MNAVTFDLSYRDAPYKRAQRLRSWLGPMAAIRTSVAREYTFKRTSHGEDALFRDWLERRIAPADVVHLPRVLYHVTLRQNKPEFGGATYNKAEDAPVALSIVCPALLCRAGLSPILADLCAQAEGKPVEVLALQDNMRMSTGEKLEHLYRTARGEFTAAVADDDEVTPDYVDTLLEAVA